MDSSGEEISDSEISGAKTDTHTSTDASDSDSSTTDSHSSSSDSYSSSSDSDSSSTDSHSSSTDSDSSSTDTDSLSTDSDSSSTDTSMDLKPTSIKKKGAKVAFKCPVCKYKCASTGRVSGHLVEEHGRKKFECDKCSFSTANKTSLLNHKRCYCQNRNIMKKKKKQVQHIQQEDNVKKPKSRIINNRVIFMCQYCN